MRAVLTVIGKDGVGILAKISTQCANHNANIVDVNQTIMQDMFCMVMLVEIDKLNLLCNENIEKANFFDNFKEISKNWTMKSKK